MAEDPDRNPRPRSSKPWGGRFGEGTDPAVERFSASVHFDRALARHDLRASRAHARMLAAQGLVSDADRDFIMDAGEARRLGAVRAPRQVRP